MAGSMSARKVGRIANDQKVAAAVDWGMKLFEKLYAPLTSSIL